jgi:hypothetical protein
MSRSGAAPGQTLAEGLISAQRPEALSRPASVSALSSPAITRRAPLGNEKIVVEESDGERITETGYRALRRLCCVFQRDRTQRKHREQSAIRPAANAVCQPCLAELLSPAATGWSTSRLEPLSGAAAKAVPTVPSGGRALASILQLLFTTIAARARPFRDRV